MQYPNVFRRYVATLIDAGVLWGFIVLIARSHTFTQSAALTSSLCVALVLSYEPLLTVYASTAGQALMRFRVRAKEGLERIQLSQAYARLIVKYMLGVISLLTIPARPDRRAIHDLAADTIVVEARARDHQ